MVCGPVLTRALKGCSGIAGMANLFTSLWRDVRCSWGGGFHRGWSRSQVFGQTVATRRSRRWREPWRRSSPRHLAAPRHGTDLFAPATRRRTGTGARSWIPGPPMHARPVCRRGPGDSGLARHGVADMPRTRGWRHARRGGRRGRLVAGGGERAPGRCWRWPGPPSTPWSRPSAPSLRAAARPSRGGRRCLPRPTTSSLVRCFGVVARPGKTRDASEP